MRIEVEENLTHTTPHDLKEERKTIKSEKRPRIVASSGSLLHRGKKSIDRESITKCTLRYTFVCNQKNKQICTNITRSDMKTCLLYAEVSKP